MLYNAARRYYVLLVSLSSLDRSVSEVAWAVSVSPWGPFKFDSARWVLLCVRACVCLGVGFVQIGSPVDMGCCRV